MNVFSTDIKQDQFDRICRIVKDKTGIALRPGKEALVRARLSRRLRELNMNNFSQYIRLVESSRGGHELQNMLEAITTNKTEFFRGPDHYQYLAKVVLLERLSHRMRFWSAGCSTGEEPHGMAIVLKENIPDFQRRDILILATDISRDVLDQAREGIYDKNRLQPISPAFRAKYFHRVGSPETGRYRVNDDLRSMIRFRRLNLMADWPMAGPFDVIFCRNVMIYFDKATQQALVSRFWNILENGGYLFVGHSEGLTGLSHPFLHQSPTIYKKVSDGRQERITTP